MSLEEFKVILGDKAKELTEEEIIKLKDNQEKMFNIFFNMWLKERNKKTQ